MGAVMHAPDEQVPGQLALPETVLVGDHVVARTTGHRDGNTYDAHLDYERLNAQSKRVYNVMRDGMWRTLRQISDQTGDPEASVSARLRDFRKQRFGGLDVQRRREAGTWLYRLVVTEP